MTKTQLPTKEDLKSKIQLIQRRVEDSITLYNTLAETIAHQGLMDCIPFTYYNAKTGETINADKLPDNWENKRYKGEQLFTQQEREIYQWYLIHDDNAVINWISEAGGLIVKCQGGFEECTFFARECFGQSIWLDSIFEELVFNWLKSYYNLEKEKVLAIFGASNRSGLIANICAY